MRRPLFACVASLAIACGSDYGVTGEPHPTPLPPPEAPSVYGIPPDWSTCAGGYYGEYYNLAAADPAVEPTPGEDPVEGAADPRDTALFQADALAFTRFDPSLDFGPAFWPVDQGWVGDPSYFSARWLFWVRARSRTTWEVSVGADDDLWIAVNGDVAVSLPALHAFAPRTVGIPLEPGQYPVELWFAHRQDPDSALRFRSLPNDAVDLCYPGWEE